MSLSSFLCYHLFSQLWNRWYWFLCFSLAYDLINNVRWRTIVIRCRHMHSYIADAHGLLMFYWLKSCSCVDHICMFTYRKETYTCLTHYRHYRKEATQDEFFHHRLINGFYLHLVKKYHIRMFYHWYYWRNEYILSRLNISLQARNTSVACLPINISMHHECFMIE
jgi:hypothetical protein